MNRKKRQFFCKPPVFLSSYNLAAAVYGCRSILLLLESPLHVLSKKKPLVIRFFKKLPQPWITCTSYIFQSQLTCLNLPVDMSASQNPSYCQCNHQLQHIHHPSVQVATCRSKSITSPVATQSEDQ